MDYLVTFNDATHKHYGKVAKLIAGSDEGAEEYCRLEFETGFVLISKEQRENKYWEIWKKLEKKELDFLFQMFVDDKFLRREKVRKGDITEEEAVKEGIMEALKSVKSMIIGYEAAYHSQHMRDLIKALVKSVGELEK